MKKRKKRKSLIHTFPAYTYQTGGRRVGAPPVHHPSTGCPLLLSCG